MTDQIVLTIPEDISARARQIAETTDQPVEQILLDHLKTLSTPAPLLAPQEQTEPDVLMQTKGIGQTAYTSAVL